MDLIDLQINRFYNQIYQSGEENISTNVLFKNETFWMTQNGLYVNFWGTAINLFGFFHIRTV